MVRPVCVTYLCSPGVVATRSPAAGSRLSGDRLEAGTGSVMTVESHNRRGSDILSEIVEEYHGV